MEGRGAARHGIFLVVLLGGLACPSRSRPVLAECPDRPLAGLWRFEEQDGTTAADASFMGHDGTLTAGAEFVEDPERGSVVSFDGFSWIAIGAGVAELGDADFSYAAWVKTTRAGGVIVSKQDEDAAWESSEKKLYISPGAGDGGGSPAGAVSTVGWGTDWISSLGPRVDDGEWHHIALTFERAMVGMNPGRIYVDGEEVTGYAKQGYNGRADNPTDTVYIGRSPGGEATANFLGLLDDVAIFTIVLAPEQIEAIMDGDFSEFTSDPPDFTEPVIEGAPASDTAFRGLPYVRRLAIQGCPDPTLEVEEPMGGTITAAGLFVYDTDLEPEGAESFDVTIIAANAEGEAEVSWTVILEEEIPELVGLWRFEEGADATAADSSLAGHEGVLTGGAAFAEDPERGAVASFDGLGWIAIDAAVAELGDADFSYAAWVKTTRAGGVIISKQSDDATWQPSEKKLYISPGAGDNGGSPAGAVSTVGWGTDWISSLGPRVDDGEWHHIALTFERAMVGMNPGEIYVDGEEVTGYAKQGYNGRPDNPTDTVYIGRSPGGEATGNFVGLLDDVAIFTIVLTPEQIQDVMDGDFSAFGIGGPVRPAFLRADVDGTGNFTIGDGIQILERLFAERTAFGSSCEDAGDVDDDGHLTIGDAVRVFNYLFAGGADPAPPFPTCGPDPTPGDALDCAGYPAASCP